MKPKPKTTRANIVQTEKDAEGKPGLFQWKGVNRFKIQDGILLGLDGRGRCILATPMSGLSLATIEET